MAEQEAITNISVTWRGNQLNVDIPLNATMEELGSKLQKLTNVMPNTLRLLIPYSGSKGSKLVYPFSEEHSKCRLNDFGTLERKPVRMMGIFSNEIEEVSDNGTRLDLRIAGFAEEDNRLRQRMAEGPPVAKLPKGTYIFCDFHTLQIPGIELSPPATEALKIMHTLASDPGIVAVMNKHHWRVGIMSELAPIGYVGVSPKCILGFNKNQGEEISLRLRTDDLKGFRKYESIKKTLLHELAHMVYSEHDENFFALNKQLNQEAISLDWTKSRSQTLTGHKNLDAYGMEFHQTMPKVYKLGGTGLNKLADARTASVQAAYDRFLSASIHTLENQLNGGSTAAHVEADVCDSVKEEPNFQKLIPGMMRDSNLKDDGLRRLNDDKQEQELDDCRGSLVDLKDAEPDPDDSETKGEIEVVFRRPAKCQNRFSEEPDPDDHVGKNCFTDKSEPEKGSAYHKTGNIIMQNAANEPDPDDFLATVHVEQDAEHASLTKVAACVSRNRALDSSNAKCSVEENWIDEPDPDDLPEQEISNSSCMEIDQQNKLQENKISEIDDHLTKLNEDPEIKRIQDPVSVLWTRLDGAIEILRSETTPTEAASILQTLLKIVRNVIEHPTETKFRRLRKGNPIFQKYVANHKAAMEILAAVGFCDDVSYDGMGRSEAFLVLKRNDLGLLWLAKSSLEVSIA
ncbi:uncharacterized protein LOC116259288 isoform X2 [Nymphaea colorata]|nr:uncharacterized protein LOC116259288 isoform X2 [Nymphaea colorata]